MDDFEDQVTEEIKINPEHNAILHSLDEGVFFLNREFELDEEYSRSFQSLLDQEIKGGMPFLDLLKNRVPENTIKNVQEFLNLMFRNDLDEETVRELNPLNIIEFHFENTWGLWTSSKYFSFKFKRINNETLITKILGTVSDITREVSLTRKLEKVEENTKRQMEWLVSILRVPPPLLKEFVTVTQIEMQQIDERLKNSRGTEDCRPILSNINRSLHQLRSNASLLNLHYFKNKLEAFEFEIDKIRKKNKISGTDFVPAVIQLGEVRNMLDETKSLMQRFKHITKSIRPTRRFEGGMLKRSIENLVINSAKKLGKKIQFDCEKFDPALIPYSDQQIVREFLVILTRFSIFYGIEEPDERISANKSPVGIVEMETFADRRIYGFRLRHDGRLIRIERLLQKTIESSEEKMSQENTTQLGSEVVRLLFMPNLATANLLEAEYGQELFSEMELAKKKLKMHGGKIKITFTSENFCEYTISLPRK
jgi:hypothetical protein